MNDINNPNVPLFKIGVEYCHEMDRENSEYRIYELGGDKKVLIYRELIID